MKDFDCEYDFGGAPVVYSDVPAPPSNPLNRPEIHYKKFILSVIGLFFTVSFSFLCSKWFLNNFIFNVLDIDSRKCTILVIFFFSAIYIRIFIKKGLIWLVHLYQHYAPDEVRLKCVFEPSCSEYMILSIQKYGVTRGVFKGVYRLFRCHPPNGGHDEP